MMTITVTWGRSGTGMTTDPFPFSQVDTARILSWTDRRIADAAAFPDFADTIVPATSPFGHATSLSFVAAEPTLAALSFDVALGSAGMFADNRDGGARAIHAESQTLRWIAYIAGLVRLAKGHDVWVHVDGAYEAAALCGSGMRQAVAGIEGAHALIVDLYKWILVPIDSFALLYRGAGPGVVAHRRSGALLCLRTRWRGEMVFRLCIVNPQTDSAHVMTVLDTLG